MSVAGFLRHGVMDREEAQLVIEVVKSGSVFIKKPDLDSAMPDEGTTMTYDAQRDRFVLRRYEVGDWIIHANGFNETLILSEQDLLRLLTGKLPPPSSAWFHMSESNHYRFDFDPPFPAKKPAAQSIRERMDIRDLACLRCDTCNSRRVEPMEYSVSVNPGRAMRYVHFAGRCLDCGRDFVSEWDD